MKYLKQTLLICLLVAPLAAKAGLWEDLKLNDFGPNTNLIGTKPGEEVDVKQRVAAIINMVLSFLGMLFTILIIYGGFRWMTARGNSQQVDDAKETIKNATIGLAIVLLSYVIARTVLAIFDVRSTPPAP